MRTDIRSWLPLIAAAGLCALALSWRAGATAAPGTMAPQTSVAVVNLEQVVMQLAEVRDRQTQLQQHAERLQLDFDAKNEELKQLAAQREELPSGSDARLQKVIEVMRLEATIAAEGEVWQSWFVVEQGRMLKEMFGKVEQTIESIATRDGWDVVLWNHGTNPAISLETRRAEQYEEMNRRVMARTIAYSSPRADITQQVIDTMNNAYAAGQ